MLIGIEASHANKQRRTGVEQVCWYLLQELKKVIPSNVRVVLYSQQPLQGELARLPENWSVKIMRWPLRKGWTQFRLSWEFLFHKPDVFFAPGQLVPFICPSNTLTVVHDSAFRAYPRAYGLASRWYLRCMNKLICRKSKTIVTPSTFSKKELEKYYKFSSADIKVVPWGYDQTKFKPSDIHSEIFKKYKITKPYIISVGRLEEKKNTKQIIKAFNHLKSNLLPADSALQLVLVGSPGVGYGEVSQEIEKSPYQQDIISPGWVGDDLPLLYSQARAFAFPSLYEGFGLPVLEAMACACPVVLSRIAALEEVGGPGAVYVNPSSEQELAQALARLLSDQDYRQKQVSYGLDRVKSFNWPNSAASVWTLLSKLA